MSDVKSMIEAGKTSLGIEFGSTRIKAVLVGEDNAPMLREAMNGRTVLTTVSGLTR